MINSIPCLRQKSRKHTLAGRTSSLSPYKGVPPPPTGLNARQSEISTEEAFCSNSLNISNCRCKRKFSSTCRFYSMHKRSVISSSCILHNFWNCSAFSKETSTTIKKFERIFQWNSVKVSDCRAFSSIKTFPGCQSFTWHSEKIKRYKKLIRIKTWRKAFATDGNLPQSVTKTADRPRKLRSLKINV